MSDTAPTTVPSPLLADAPTADGVPILALRPRDASKALGLSLRTLWQATKDGRIPHVKLNGAVLYPVDTLRTWLSQEASKEAAQ